MLLLLIVGSGSVWGQSPVEITTDEDITNNTKKLYLIQTNAFPSFYIAPQANNTITTNNILGDYMLWYFLDAGKDNPGTENEIQYYYIVNNSTGKYVSHGDGSANNNTSRGVPLVVKDQSNDESCKFKLVLNESKGEDFYNIIVKGSQNYYALNKRGGSMVNTNPIQLTNNQYVNDIHSLWKFIPYESFTWPTPPFTLSDDSEKHYYEIHNIQKNTYYAATDATADKVIFTNKANESRAWYLKEAASDSWYKYYYIINPATGGKYMYYNGTATDGKDQKNAVSVEAYDSENGDRYQFVVVQAARGDGNSRVPCYAIIPKLLIENLWTSSSLGYAQASIINGLNMGIINSRGENNGAHWEFKTTTFSTVCDHPVIAFDRTTGKASITTATLLPKIYFTTDETTPSSTNGTLYEGPFPLTEQTTVKAIVTKDGYTDSDVTTLTIYKVATPTIQQETGTLNVSITTATPDATIYYTIDGTTPTTSSTLYTGASEELGGKPIKAIAVKNNMINSDIGEGEINISCTTPVISFNNITSMVSITCGTEGSTIHYTTDNSEPTPTSTEYTGAFTITSETTVKAIATHATLNPSAVAELVIPQVATPTIQNNGSNAISITTATPGATIYYTTDGSTPTTSSTVFIKPLTDNVSNVNIKAIAVKKNMITSAVGSGSVKLQCATPVINRDGLTFSLSCDKPTNASLYYTMGGGSETLYSGPVAFTKDQLPMTVTVVARHSDYVESAIASMELKTGSGTPDDPYLIYGSTDFANFITNVNNGTTASDCYKLGTDVTASGTTAVTTPFTGTFDGDGYTISSLEHALFNTVNGGTVKNVILDNVNISGNDNGNAGAICCEATGDTRIYNCGVLASSSTVTKDEDGYDKITLCSSSISGSNYAGSIVGLLDGSARVINCFSYANVSGGTVGGIVGYNNVATTASNLKTMVMNCMYYGEVSGSSIAPIYNGEIITNDGDANGVNNFNYFRLESSYIEDTNIAKVYNCALGAETRFLQRFEFFRHLLNSNRELAAWWATGSAANKDEMMKWVLEPSQIGSSTPYPVLKAPDYYPSVVNIDTENAPLTSERNKGGMLGSLSVTIQSGSGAVYGAPTGASITKPSLTLNITDKDADHFNFNYYKVQLPYYNEVGTCNYTENRVVTGWKIVSVTTDGSVTSYNDFTTGDDAPAYNFADRKCTAKDIYSETNKRVFNQGAYWDVPEGVTGITIQPYWGKAVYLADAYWDVTYQNSGTDAMATAVNVETIGGGQRYGNGETFNSQTVYTAIGDAIASSALYAGTNEATYSARSVYDYAVVLVGNYHHISSIAAGGKPYTVTSVDLDGDNEPDYSLMLRFNGRTVFHPVRYDFLNILGLGMAQKTTGGTGSYNLGIIQPKYWFESTNTSLFHVTQFEYDRSDRGAAPYIVQGGVMEQWVSGQNNGAANNTIYFHVGGNVWFKEFHRGTHQDKTLQSKHPPVSVTGGDYDEFYLTGLYTANVANYEDNAECYINGGRFGVVAGAAMEGIGKANGADNTGNITWQVQNADIKEFYAGGINAAKPVTGNLSTTITGGKIDLFCGGPKFGDMSTGKTVTTNATDCIFGTFFGAGYGGNSYSRQAPRNHNNIINFPHKDKEAGNDDSWNAWLGRFYTQSYNATYGGVSTQFSYQFLPMSGNVDNCARIFVEYVKFSLATCRNVTSTLTGCKITGNFYGGGSLGKVDGPVTSTLTNCELQGNAFGAGFSASLPPVEVDNIGFETEPFYYTDLGTYRTGVKSGTETYTWQEKTGESWVDNTNHILYTTEDLTTLGAVTGKVTLTIDGTTTVAESVYGGGEESTVGGDTEVNVTGGTIGTIGKGGATWGNVYGGGKGKENDVTAGLVKGNTNINISGSPSILHNIYGGGAYGSVGTFTYDGTTGMPTALATSNTGACMVTIKGGTIGSNGNENGMVFGSSRGDVAIPEGEPAVDPNDRMAWVYSTHVTIGDTGVETTPWIRGSVYGSGENGHTFQNTIIDIQKGTIGIAVGETVGDYSGAAYPYRGNVYGGGCGTDKYDSDNDGIKDSYNPLAGIVRGTTTVNITGGQVVHNVYGAGAMGSVGNASDAESGKTTINISGGRIGYDGNGNGHVFGAARGEFGISTAASGLANVRESEVNINYATTPAADNEGKTAQLIAGSVFGGGEAGTVKGSVIVKMTGGLIMKDIYGGGALADTQTSNWDATKNSGAGDWASGKTSASTTTTVRLTGGNILGEAYGGGLGETDKPAYVYGDVLLDLNGTTTSGETGTAIAEDARGCAVHEVFGCNNASGTPMGKVMVHIYATQNKNLADILTKPEKGSNSFDVAAVYGGGNLAAYEPAGGASTTNSTNVIIEGCDLTSIQYVYGGGNAAPVPGSHVLVKSCYEIERVFGGGNGFDNLDDGSPNPGANVGYMNPTYSFTPDPTKSDAENEAERAAAEAAAFEAQKATLAYGSGKSFVELLGGTIHYAFGGSNTKGNVRVSATVKLDEGGTCELEIGEVYGAGNMAAQDGTSNILLGCVSFLEEMYGGSRDANINNDIELTIQSGQFHRVFGGNNLGGTISGTITVNIEETGCHPIIIGQLYGSGNRAAYTGPWIDPSDHSKGRLGPTVNVRSFSSIGEIYGGGYGESAIITGNTYVNINECVGENASIETESRTINGVSKTVSQHTGETVTINAGMQDEVEVGIPLHEAGKIGAIGFVYGGGNAAPVFGNTNITIGTLTKFNYVSIQDDAGTAEDESERDVVGVDIRGNVFGGGNKAEVTGNTNVVVGK